MVQLLFFKKLNRISRPSNSTPRCRSEKNIEQAFKCLYVKVYSHTAHNGAHAHSGLVQL